MAGEEGAMQSAYSIEVYTQALDGKKQKVWESGKVASTQSQHVQYGGKPLSRWRVTIGVSAYGTKRKNLRLGAVRQSSV